MRAEEALKWLSQAETRSKIFIIKIVLIIFIVASCILKSTFLAKVT